MLLVLGAGAASAFAASAGGSTRAHIYRAFTASGAPAIKVKKTVNGSCFSGSSAINRNDAWRCMSGNFLYDPCFSSGKAHGFVLCPAAAWKRSGIKLKLTKSLPNKLRDKNKPSTSGMPWAILTTSGLRCAIDTGATGTFHHLRANYSCRGGKWLYGSPDRKHEPWTIQAGSAHPKKLQKLAIKTAWF